MASPTLSNMSNTSSGSVTSCCMIWYCMIWYYMIWYCMIWSRCVGQGTVNSVTTP